MVIIKIMTVTTKIVNFFQIINPHPLKNNNGNVVATDKSNDSNITSRSKKSKKYNKFDKNNNSNNNNNSINNENNNNNKSSYDNKVNSTSSSPTSKETVFILGDSKKKLNGFLLTPWNYNTKQE